MSLVGCTGDTDSPQADGSDTAPVSVGVGVAAHHRQAEIGAVLRAQQHALHRHGHSRAFVSTWAAGHPAARRRAVDIVRNLHALRAMVFSLRVVPVDRGDASRLPLSAAGRPTWKAGVDVTWTMPQMRGRRVVSSLTYTFRYGSGRAVVVDVRAAGGSREPIWLAGRLRVRRAGPDVLATASTGEAASSLAHRLLVARTDVRAFFEGVSFDGRSRDGRSVVRRGWPHWNGSLTAYLPGTDAEFDAILGAAPHQYDDVAAVTTPVGRSTTRHAPVAIVVNPRIWPHLRPVGAHVVVTHEAVHAATGPVTTELPDWVAEGFADYVAVRSAGVPLDVASEQAIKSVRLHGLPHRLPTVTDFATTGARLERTYELSRLAVTAIARTYGRRHLIAFYDDLVAHPGELAGAVHRQLGTSVPALTGQWRRLLVRLPGAQ
jgi:hypothetical protein